MPVVQPSQPANSLKEFLALARDRLHRIVYASCANGSHVQLAMAPVASTADLKMTHIPQKRSGAPASISSVSVDAPAMLAAIGSVMTQIDAKKLRPLAVASNECVKPPPKLPTIAEASGPGYEFKAWTGAFAPARMPAAIVDMLDAEPSRARSDPGVAKELSGQALDPMPMTPAAFAKRLKSDYDKHGRLIKEDGARID
jgi:tripartite-type tricarboxylate transporter receptor subunit TctC